MEAGKGELGRPWMRYTAAALVEEGRGKGPHALALGGRSAGFFIKCVDEKQRRLSGY